MTLEEEMKERNEFLELENKKLKEQLEQSDDAAIAAYETQATTDNAILAIYDKIGV